MIAWSGPIRTLAPGVNIAGEVQIGEGVFAGIGAKIIPRTRVGDWAIIGAGAVVIRDVKEAAERRRRSRRGTI